MVNFAENTIKQPCWLTEGLLVHFEEWLPESDALQTFPPLLFEFSVGILCVRRGEKRVLLQEEFEAIRRSRVKPLRAPSAQICLLRALEYKERLERDGISQAALACELGVTRVRLTQILNLLKLHPKIQGQILQMKSTSGRSGISESRLRALVGRDGEYQLEEFSILAKKSIDGSFLLSGIM